MGIGYVGYSYNRCIIRNLNDANAFDWVRYVNEVITRLSPRSPPAQAIALKSRPL